MPIKIYIFILLKIYLQDKFLGIGVLGQELSAEFNIVPSCPRALPS